MTKIQKDKYRQDPIKFEALLKRQRAAYRRRMNRTKNDPHKKPRLRIFKELSRRVNWRCKKGIITPLDLWSIAKKQKLTCPLSGEKITTKNISIDHILPISKGGTNDINNIRLVTFPVNIAKHTMTDAEFIQFCRSIVAHAV
jgi:5-methylcytosine-specific restriction endonuclease McrA